MICTTFSMESEMLPFKNIYKEIPTSLSEELIEVIGEGKNIRIERIVSEGHCSPSDFWYDQSESEFVVLLSGSATITFNDAKKELVAGDYCLIPAHCKHRVEQTAKGEKSVWLAVFFEGEESFKG